LDLSLPLLDEVELELADPDLTEVRLTSNVTDAVIPESRKIRRQEVLVDFIQVCVTASLPPAYIRRD
jgi:hypothetical protein